MNINKKYIFSLIACSLILLLAFASTGFDLFHTHEADHEEHEECPVHQFVIILQSTFIVIVVLFFSFFNIVIRDCCHNEIYIDKSFQPSILIRGPPFSK